MTQAEIQQYVNQLKKYINSADKTNISTVVRQIQTELTNGNITEPKDCAVILKSLLDELNENLTTNFLPINSILPFIIVYEYYESLSKTQAENQPPRLERKLQEFIFNKLYKKLMMAQPTLPDPLKADGPLVLTLGTVIQAAASPVLIANKLYKVGSRYLSYEDKCRVISKVLADYLLKGETNLLEYGSIPTMWNGYFGPSEDYPSYYKLRVMDEDKLNTFANTYEFYLTTACPENEKSRWLWYDSIFLEVNENKIFVQAKNTPDKQLIELTWSFTPDKQKEALLAKLLEIQKNKDEKKSRLNKKLGPEFTEVLVAEISAESKKYITYNGWNEPREERRLYVNPIIDETSSVSTLQYETTHSNGKQILSYDDCVLYIGKAKADKLFDVVNLSAQASSIIDKEKMLTPFLNDILHVIAYKGHAYFPFPSSAYSHDIALLKETMIESALCIEEYPAIQFECFIRMLEENTFLCKFLDINRHNLPLIKMWFGSWPELEKNRTQQGTRMYIMDYIQDAINRCVTQFLSRYDTNQPLSPLLRTLYSYQCQCFLDMALQNTFTEYRNSKKYPYVGAITNVSSGREKQIKEINQQSDVVSNAFHNVDNDNPQQAWINFMLELQKQSNSAQEDHINQHSSSISLWAAKDKSDFSFFLTKFLEKKCKIYLPEVLLPQLKQDATAVSHTHSPSGVWIEMGQK